MTCQANHSKLLRMAAAVLATGLLLGGSAAGQTGSSVFKAAPDSANPPQSALTVAPARSASGGASSQPLSGPTTVRRRPVGAPELDPALGAGAVTLLAFGVLILTNRRRRAAAN